MTCARDGKVLVSPDTHRSDNLYYDKNVFGEGADTPVTKSTRNVNSAIYRPMAEGVAKVYAADPPVAVAGLDERPGTARSSRPPPRAAERGGLSYLMETLAVAGPERLTVGDGRWLGLLRTLVTGRFEPTLLPPSFEPVANLVAASSVRFEGDRFLVSGASTEDMRFGAVFSLKAYPASTSPGIFDHFDLDFDSVVTHSFTPIEQFEALARIRRTVRQMGAADDAAASLRGQLIDAADDLASGRIGFGLHHASITVFARDEEELDEGAAQVRASGQRAGCVLVREDIGARATWFAQHPGNHGYRARAAMISSQNFAHFTALHAAPGGLAAGRTP